MMMYLVGDFPARCCWRFTLSILNRRFWVTTMTDPSSYHAYSNDLAIVSALFKTSWHICITAIVYKYHEMLNNLRLFHELCDWAEGIIHRDHHHCPWHQSP